MNKIFYVKNIENRMMEWGDESDGMEDNERIVKKIYIIMKLSNDERLHEIKEKISTI